MNVGVGCDGSLTGTCSSFAVTTPNFGYRYSHQYWWPTTTTSTASRGFSAPWMLAITRAVARKSTTTMRIGMTVQAISTSLLPYTCAGSESSSRRPLRNRATAYTSRPPTKTKIAAVTARTKYETCAITSAGVDAEAK